MTARTRPPEAVPEVAASTPAGPARRRLARPASPARKAAAAVRRKSPRQQEKEIDEQLAENLPDPQDVFDPAFRAHQLHLAGVPWREAAQRTGYADGSAAASAVAQYLQRAVNQIGAQQQQLALATQIERYEAVLRAWWEPGTTGHDERAGRMVLSTLMQLDKIQRLTDPEIAVTRETLVISADRDEYIAQLRQVVEEREAAKKTPGQLAAGQPPSTTKLGVE